MSKLLELTNAFYDAAWDFSTRLCLLPEQLTMEHDEEINPKALLQKYKAEISEFLDLNGSNIPRAHFVTYDQLDTTIRTEVFPAYEVLTETWNELREKPSTITHALKLQFAAQCTYLINLIEMTVIPQAAELREDLKLEPA